MDRVKDQVLQRIDQRVRKELAPEVQAPAIGEAPEEEQVDPGLLGRIKQRVKERVNQLTPVQQRMLDPRGPLDEATIKYRIQYAGQNHLLLFIKYNNQWRHVEPYSYRTSGTPNPAAAAKYRQQVERARSDPSTVIPPRPKREIRFYGFCRIHDEIHSFKLERIEGCIVTDLTFQPRWPIEVA